VILPWRAPALLSVLFGEEHPTMAVLKIARMGHPMLSRVADAVADPTAPGIRRLVDDMIDTMADAPGIGLAAPQVHVPLRVVVFLVPPGRTASGDEDGAPPEGVPLTVLINPVIEPLSATMAEDWEGCLSLPGMVGRVPRHTHIRYRGFDTRGGTVEVEARGMHARVVQHECDHLDGLLYPHRMTDLSTLGYKEELDKGGVAVREFDE